MIKKIKNEKDNITEKKHGQHPVLYILSVIILVVIVVTFLGSPIAGEIGRGSNISFGKFADKDIEYIPGNYLSNQKDLLAQNIDNSSDNIQFQAYQVWRAAFERTIIHTAILWFTEKSRVYVSSQKIDESVVNYGPYTVDGEFDINLYNRSSAAEKAEVRKSIHENLIKEQYLTDFFGYMKSSALEKDFIVDMTMNERSFRLAYISFDKYPENEVYAFGNENKKLFQSINLSKITILSSRRDADKVYSIIKDNPDSFADTAKNQSQDSFADTGGEMGNVFYYELTMEVKNSSDIDNIISLKSSEISSVIETNNGWAIYRGNSPVEQFDIDRNDSIPVVRQYLNRYETGKIEDYYLSLADKLKTSESYENNLKEEGFTFYETESFPINYGDNMLFKPVQIENAPPALSQINNNEEFLINAFSLKKDEISDPVILGDSLVIITLNEEIQNTEFAPMISSYYPYVKQQMNEQSLSMFFLTSDLLVDNFYETFAKYFLVN